MRFIHACKHNCILWWYMYVQMNLNPRLMDGWKGTALPCEPQADARSGQSPAPAMPHPPRCGANALNRELRGCESHMKHFKLMQKTSMDAAQHCGMAAAREHVNACGHWRSHAWDEQDRGSSSMFQWGQGIFQSRSSRLTHCTRVSACTYLHIAFSLLLLAMSVLFVGLCTLSPFSLKKCKEFLFESISPKAEVVA